MDEEMWYTIGLLEGMVLYSVYLPILLYCAIRDSRQGKNASYLHTQTMYSTEVPPMPMPSEHDHSTTPTDVLKRQSEKYHKRRCKTPKPQFSFNAVSLLLTAPRFAPPLQEDSGNDTKGNNQR